MSGFGPDATDARADASSAAHAIAVQISLLSHTNVGKTSLARTLLREDIGEIGDRAHVTEVAESHDLIESSQGDRLVLWDTPGFGDSTRVLKRLRQSDKPLGWFLSTVWDRFADRPFWCSQQALRTARNSSDLVLYVINAGEGPSSAGYVDAEMQILGWLGKPVVVLLNQLGPPREGAKDAADVAQWQAHIARFPWAESVLPFDAFARCWVQEGTLLAQLQRLLHPDKQAAFERLRAAWRARNLQVFDQSMQALAGQIAGAAADAEQFAELDMPGKARAWLGAVAAGHQHQDLQLEAAESTLAQRLDAEVRATTSELVRLHGLTGKATEEVLQRMGREFNVERPADADKASVLGGLLSGALGGLAADLGAGGLTFGAGALIGGVLGAFGARGLAKAYNLVRGAQTGLVRWSPDFLSGRVAAAMIRYLAVAHFGRGRGDFVSGVTPPHWQQAVARALERRRGELESIWAARAEADSAEQDSRARVLAQRLLPCISSSTREVLIQLYPESSSVFG